MEEETRRVFRNFIEQAERIKNYHFEDHIKEVGLGIRGKEREDGMWDWEFGLPDDKERDAFLLVFRMFYQQNDQVSILNMNRFTNDPGISLDWKERYGEARNIYLKYLKSKPETIEDGVFEGSPTHEEIVNTVLYGGLAHISRHHPETRERFLKWTQDPWWKNILMQKFSEILLMVLRFIYHISYLCQKEIDSNTPIP